MTGADAFLRTLQKSELIGVDRLQEALAGISLDERRDPKRLADRLVRMDLLTPFQAQKLLEGIWIGLRLGPYAIRTPIGRGGMGTVYLAIDSRNSRPVAIKVLSPQKAKEGERHLVRFQREMALTRKLDHSHIAQALDVGVEHGVHFLALEYVPGQTLQRLVTKHGPLSADRAARIFVDLAAGLAHAHSQNLIHRDLKPANIMIAPGDRPTILDLGLALVRGEEAEDVEVLGGKGYLVGSIDFMAPEQTRDPTRIDPRADIYALGCTLYFAVTGKAPFAETPQKEKIRAQRQSEPEPLRNRNPSIPEAFARVVERLMAKNPDDRPGSADEVRTLLLPWSDAPPSGEASFVPIAEELPDASLFRDDTLAEAFAGVQPPDATPVALENFRNLWEAETESRRRLMIGLAIGAVALGGLILAIGIISVLRR